MHDIVVVGEAVAGESAKIRAELEQAISVLNAGAFDVMELLHKVRKGHHYTTVTFQQYLETLNIKVRKAQYLVRIADVMERVGIPRAEYEPVGIAKLREITSLEPGEKYTNPVNGEQSEMTQWIKDLLASGKTSPLDEVKQSVRVLKGMVGENDIVWLNFNVKRLAADNVIRPALEKMKVLVGTVGTNDDGTAKEASDGQALEYMAAECLNDPDNEPEQS